MANNFKRILSLMLVIIMVASMSGVSVFAEGTSAPSVAPATVVGYSSYDKKPTK